MKKLSEMLQSYRIDRPDEWTMDMLKEKAEKLEAERDALAAQVEVLQREFKDARQTLQNIAGCTWDSGAEEIADVALDEAKRWVSRYDCSALKSTPQQCLAEIRAEAIEKFSSEIAKRIEVPNASPTKIEYYKAAIRHVLQFANGYAEVIRKGGE